MESKLVKIVLVHGGPGACGDLRPLAIKLAPFFGVAEPWQSKASVKGQIEELAGQIHENGPGSLILFGHSWGAWLAVLTAVQYPELVSKLILSGSPAFEEKFNINLEKDRLNRLNQVESKELTDILNILEDSSNEAKAIPTDRLNFLTKKSDSFSLIEVPRFDGELRMDLFGPVWTEAVEMRDNGDLLRSFSKIQCSITVIHGKNDPHPFEGVIDPLLSVGVRPKVKLFSKCGHYPWLERYAWQDFYDFLKNEIEEE